MGAVGMGRGGGGNAYSWPRGNVSAPSKVSTVTAPPPPVRGHVPVWDFLTSPGTMGFGHLF